MDALAIKVPVYSLYGEEQPWMTPDALHVELISDRSSHYDWHIPAHRHAGLMHYVYVRRGAATLHLKGLLMPYKVLQSSSFQPWQSMRSILNLVLTAIPWRWLSR
jgi:hypothetical protein